MRRMLLTAAICLCAAAASAHHSPARFIQDQVVVVSGTVTRYDWSNPHVYVTVGDADRNEWLLEANATSILRRNGWSGDTFSPGDMITFRANPNRDKAKRHVSLISIIDANGVTFDSRVARQNGATMAEASSTNSLDGVWRGDPAIAFKMLFAMIDHPLTEKGQAARDRYDESMDPIAQCVPWPTPRIVAWNAFYLVELEQNDDVFFFRSEFANVERVIHMDGRGHPQNADRTNQGHSVGHWDGNTLVVDTSQFADSRSPVADGIPSGASKHVVERYTLSEDGTRIDVDILVEDPEFLAEPFTAALTWYYSPNLEMLRFDCDPDTARRFIQ
jgi:hypothetical protein